LHCVARKLRRQAGTGGRRDTSAVDLRGERPSGIAVARLGDLLTGRLRNVAATHTHRQQTELTFTPLVCGLARWMPDPHQRREKWAVGGWCKDLSCDDRDEECHHDGSPGRCNRPDTRLGGTQRCRVVVPRGSYTRASEEQFEAGHAITIGVHRRVRLCQARPGHHERDGHE